MLVPTGKVRAEIIAGAVQKRLYLRHFLDSGWYQQRPIEVFHFRAYVTDTDPFRYVDHSKMGENENAKSRKSQTCCQKRYPFSILVIQYVTTHPFQYHFMVLHCARENFLLYNRIEGIRQAILFYNAQLIIIRWEEIQGWRTFSRHRVME